MDSPKKGKKFHKKRNSIQLKTRPSEENGFFFTSAAIADNEPGASSFLVHNDSQKTLPGLVPATPKRNKQYKESVSANKSSMSVLQMPELV